MTSSKNQILKRFCRHVYIFRMMQSGKPRDMISFFQTPTLHLETALRQYDEFLILILFQHQTILSAVGCFLEDAENPCVMLGSALEGCFLPKNLNNGKGNAVEFDFFVRLPTPVAGESAGTLQYTQLGRKPHQVLLKLSNPSIIESEYIGIERAMSNLKDSLLKKRKDGFYLKRNFMEAMEEKIQNSLCKVLVQKPAGMEMASRSDTGCSIGLQASLNVSFFKPITERLDMLPLDPDSWSGDAMTNAQMMWVNLTNWSLSCCSSGIFKVHLILECEWPADASVKWLQRERYWPSEKTVQKVARSPCYLHPLWHSEKEQLVDEEVMAFQMTFGVAEYLLFSETGPKERQCMVFLKAINEKYFLNSRVLSSFAIKMVFFWHLESTSLAVRQGMGRGELLVCLLDKLISFLNVNNLPHFFIPSVNLLEGLDADEVNNTLRQLKKVKRSMFDYLPSDLFQVKCSRTLNDDFVQKVLQFVN